jgi:glutamyl-tRNA reductase
LDSAILGDVQITSQVKEAIETARNCGSLGRYLDRTFTHALRSGKRARTHTRIGYGAASLGSALAGIIAVRCASIHHAAPVPKILIIGAGEIARDIGRHLAKRALGDLIFVNRTKSKAKSLALECNGEFLPWSWLSQALFQVDIAIAATTAVEPVLSRALLDALATERSERSLLVVDAGLPRNVEPGSLVEVIGIDSIREQQKEVLDERRSAVPHVERIIDEELKAWEQWRASLPLERLIKDLYLGVAEHSREAARSFAMETGVAPVVAEQILLRSLKRMLHPHVRRMRSSK